VFVEDERADAFSAQRRDLRRENKPSGRYDFAVRAHEGIFRAVGSLVNEPEDAVWTRLISQTYERLTSWMPPLRDVLRLRPGVEDDGPRGIKGASDHNLAIGRQRHLRADGLVPDGFHPYRVVGPRRFSFFSSSWQLCALPDMARVHGPTITRTR
jgi:hypothetical protein